MGIIRYELVTGNLPMTVSLEGSGLPDQVRSSYGQYSFIGVTAATNLLIVDNLGCSKIINVQQCLTCPSGYTYVVGGCEKTENLTPTSPTDPRNLVHNSNIRYGTTGTVVFGAGWNYNGSGSVFNYYNGGSFWVNPVISGGNGDTVHGIMNVNAVWSSLTLDNQYIGFPIYFTTVVEKQYYIGLGCDNIAEIKLDGVSILMQDTASLYSMFTTNGWSIPNASESTFRLWYIYPVLLSAGSHIIELIGHNTVNAAAVGMDIYDMSETDLMNCTSYADMGSNLIFSSKDEVGQPVLIGNMNQGYTCDIGYILGNPLGTPTCYKFTHLACGELPPSTRTTAWRPINQYCVQSVQTQYWYGLSKCVSDGQTYFTGPYLTQALTNNERVMGATDVYYTVGTMVTQEPSFGNNIAVTTTSQTGCPVGTTTTTTVAPNIIPCGTPTNYNGGAAFPSLKTINLGSGTGTVTLSYDAKNVPDKFIVEFDGVPVIDTGYRGHSGNQQSLTDALALKGLPNEIIQGVGLGSATFVKSTATTTATVKVYAPIGGTVWSFTMSCPIP